MGSDWREAARGIPAEEGDRVLWARDLTPHGIVTRALPSGAWAVERYEEPGHVDACHPLAVVVDLSHPPTRAKFDRRLALALGAPEGAVERGVAFVPMSPRASRWLLVAGLSFAVYDDNGRREALDWDWERPLGLGTDDPLLARALAWPADRRVSS